MNAGVARTLIIDYRRHELQLRMLKRVRGEESMVINRLSVAVLIFVLAGWCVLPKTAMRHCRPRPAPASTAPAMGERPSRIPCRNSGGAAALGPCLICQ